MTSAITPREWSGFESFPEATKEKLKSLMEELKAQNKNSMTVMVLGKSGVGKSSTLNTILGERVFSVSAFQPESLRISVATRAYDSFTISLIDTPGLVESGAVNRTAVKAIVSALVGRRIDVLLYVDRLDVYRMENIDSLTIRAISDAFGPEVWESSLVCLTHSQLSPPDSLPFSSFVERRGENIVDLIRQHAKGKVRKGQIKIPVCLVENSARCKTNEDGEKIVPDGSAWVPSLYTLSSHTVLSLRSPSLTHTPLVIKEEMIEGPDPNKKGKFLIPALLLLQFFLVFNPLRKAIDRDIEDDRLSRPKWEIKAEEYRKSGAAAKALQAAKAYRAQSAKIAGKVTGKSDLTYE